MDLATRVKSALQTELQADFVLIEDDDGITGFVVAQRFRQMDHLGRQAEIDAAIRNVARLSKAEMRQILAVAAFTPEEAEAHGLRSR